MGLHYSRVRDGAAVIGLDILRIELEGLRRVGDSETVGLGLDVGLGAVAEEGRVLVVLGYGVSVVLDCGGEVMVFEGLVALEFEGCCS